MSDVALAGVAAALVLGMAVGTLLTRRRFVRSAQTVKVAEDRASQSLEAAEQAVGARDLILSSMEEGILLIDATGKVLFSNPSLRQLLGLNPESTQTLSPAPLRRAVTEAADSLRLLTVEVEVGSPTRWLLGSAAPVGSDGSVLLVLRDITKEKRLDAVRQDLVANASHELKSPAAAIQAAAETIRRASVEDPAAVPRFAEQLEREAMRLSRIVSDLLDLSRLETGTMFDEPVALEEVVREEAERSAEAAREAGLVLEVDAEPVVIEGSGRDLALLVRNLIDNAVRYSAEGGTVHVELAARDGEAVLLVRDTGSGIPSRDLPRIFERFYRVDRARSRDTGGTGLGLSIVKHVAENHGGSVTVESELGAGSLFTVRIPAGAPEAGASSSAREAAGTSRLEVVPEGPASR